MDNAFVIAGRLSHGQAQTIRSLTRDPCILGCSEPTAQRLSEQRSTRPALTVRTFIDGAAHYALTDVGVAIQEKLGGELRA